MIAILYYGTVILLLIYLIGVFLYICALIVSALDGAPYVKTAKSVRTMIFDQAQLTKKSRLIEVGSGTGELAYFIQKTYHCRVTGIEANPLLHFISKLKNSLFGTKKIQFIHRNATDYNYKEATHIYIFLLPAILRKVAPRLQSTCKPGTIIITYGFCLPTFKSKLLRKTNLKPYPIYYYKL